MFSLDDLQKLAVDKVIHIDSKCWVLASGQTTHVYFDWRPVMGDAYYCKMMAGLAVAFAAGKGLGVDCFYGIPEGATPLAIAANIALAEQSSSFGPGSHVLPVGRVALKGHGETADRYVTVPPRGRVCVLEDTTTTGDSLASRGLDRVLAVSGAELVGAVALTNRMNLRGDGKSTEEFIRDKYSVPFYWLTTGPALIASAFPRVRKQLGDQAVTVARELEEEYRRSGIELKLL